MKTVRVSTFPLPVPVICECGFSTMDAQVAIEHLRDKHPEEWAKGLEEPVVNSPEVSHE